MFDQKVSSIGLPAGEADVASGWCDDDSQADLITVDEWNTGWVPDDRHVLLDLDSLPPGPFLLAILESVDPSRLNGFDLVRMIQATERLVSHVQASSMSSVYELAHAAPGDAESEPDRLADPDPFAADELRPALTITRRAADLRLSVAFDLVERLPRVWELLSEGQLDLPRSRVIADGTAHLDVDEARRIVEIVSEKAPRLTTGQLAAWIRRLCVEVDPVQADKRAKRAVGQRALTIEPTVDGTAHIHLWDIPLADAQAVGRRVNGHMISLRKDGDTRSHDNLRADIALDFLLGADPTNSGRALFDMKVDLTTLAGLDEKAAEIPGLGPVVADVARQYADRHHRSEWQVTIFDDDGNVVDVITTSRRPTRRISRLVNASQPVCSFPGCRMPAKDCDFDHLLPAALGGPTSMRNGGPKCRHDHVLKHRGWKHRRVRGNDYWTSPRGHTYKTEKPP
jgi:hypothetical protein